MSSPIYPTALQDAESILIRERRARAGPNESPAVSLGDARIGLALSGGGIRSATFCLGVLQALSRANVLPRIDFLSTVSGGGFCGTMLGGLFQRGWKRDGGTEQQASGYVKNELDQLGSPTIRWLRKNGRYLAPDGAGDDLLWAASILRNWLALQTVIGGAILALFTGLWLLRGYLQLFEPMRRLEAIDLPAGVASRIWWSPLWPLLVVVIAAFALPIGWGYWLSQRTKWFPSVVGVFVIVGASGIVVDRLGDAGWGNGWFVAAGIAGAVALASVIWWTMATVLVPSQRWTVVMAALTTLAATGWSLDRWVVSAAHGASPPAGWLAISLLLALVLSGLSGTAAKHEMRQVLRFRMTQWLGVALAVSAVLALGFLADTAVQTIYLHLNQWIGRSATASSAGGAGLALVAQRIWKWITARRPTGRPTVPVKLLAWLGSLALAVLFLFALSAVTVGIAFSFAEPAYHPAVPAGIALQINRPGLALAFGSLVILVLLTSRLFVFLNLSSQQQAYSARLTRAYLGVSNRDRTSGGGTPPTRAVEGDDLPFADYHPERFGGPLHLINVTVNETLSGTSPVEQRDRKGLCLVVGPAGVTAAARHHALWDEKEPTSLRSVAPAAGFRVWPSGRVIRPEALTVGRWAGISGAAFTTGSGQHTSLATSLLCGLLNIRLGYWWDSGVDPAERPNRTPVRGLGAVGAAIDRIFPVQAALFAEVLARFHGTARRSWYLSDGGHFENTAGYELIRRRLPLIVVCDCGRDPDGSCEDLAGLVRKARIDLNAEIRFFDEAELEALPNGLGKMATGCRWIGHQSEFRRSMDGGPGTDFSKCHAALAWITYSDEPDRRSVLLVLKPTLTGDEPLDLVQYGDAVPEFPQQSTADQFFDEAQWESYRRLGEHVAGGVVDLDLVDHLLRMAARNATPS